MFRTQVLWCGSLGLSTPHNIKMLMSVSSHAPPTGFLCQRAILPLVRGCVNQSPGIGGMGTHSKWIIKRTGLHTEESKEAKAWTVTERSKTLWSCYKYQSWKMDFHSIIRNLCKKPARLIYSLSWWWAHSHNYDLYGTRHWINSVTSF